jgi:predicted HTH transcriptional regulator
MASSPILSQESAFARRKRLFERVVRGDLSREIACDLLPSGQGLLYEKDLWDYKAELPTLPTDRRPSDVEKELYSAKMAEVVKDVVSFYNSYGGYILAGIDDKTREVVGYAGRFDCADLAKKVYGVTRHEIDCHYVIHEIQTQRGLKTVGMLFIPRRPYSRNPAQFLRDAPPGGSSKQAYKANQIYFRFGDECKAAQNSGIHQVHW